METISAREIDRYIFDKKYLLVDVRNPSEYRKQHIRIIYNVHVHIE